MQKTPKSNSQVWFLSIVSSNFMPDTGKITFLKTPEPSSTIRVETGVREGDEVTVYYDPMIAKLIVHGQDRPTALRHLRKALQDFKV